LGSQKYKREFDGASRVYATKAFHSVLFSARTARMVSAVVIVFIALPLYWIYSIYSSLQRNIKIAKLSGLPVVIIREQSPL
jgi:hypothetical protein